MVNLFRTSSSKPSVDIFCACSWTFFLFLSLVTWLLPLSPYVQTLGSNPPPPRLGRRGPAPSTTAAPQDSLAEVMEATVCNTTDKDGGLACKLAGEAVDKITKVENMGKDQVPEDSTDDIDLGFDIRPEFKADCWCPAQFERSQVAYTNRVCANALNAAVRGLGLQSTAARVSFPDLSKPPLPNGPDDSSRNRQFLKIIEEINERDDYKERRNIFERCNALTTKKTALVLFVFALVLMCPEILRKLLCAGYQLENTLMMLQAAQQTQDRESRRQIYRRLSQGTSAITSSARMFLVCKVVTCFLALVLLVFTVSHVMPQLQDVSSELAGLSDVARLTPLQDYLFSTCTYVIRRMSNQHEYRVQCMYYPAASDQGGRPGRESGLGKLERASDTVDVYLCLYSIVCAFLVLHVTANVISTTCWVARLYCGTWCASGTAFGSGNTHLSSDVRFLLGLAYERFGHVTYSELAQEIEQQQATVPPFSGGKDVGMEDNI